MSQNVGHRAAAPGGTVGGQGFQAGAVLQGSNTGMYVQLKALCMYAP